MFEEVEGSSFFSLIIAGLTTGSIGSLGETVPDLMSSAEMRSFSLSAPMLAFWNWESKNKWMSNGLDRGNRLKSLREKSGATTSCCKAECFAYSS